MVAAYGQWPTAPSGPARRSMRPPGALASLIAEGKIGPVGRVELRRRADGGVRGRLTGRNTAAPLDDVVTLVVEDMIRSGGLAALLDRPDRNPDRTDGLTADAELSIDGALWAMDVMTMRWRTDLKDPSRSCGRWPSPSSPSFSARMHLWLTLSEQPRWPKRCDFARKGRRLEAHAYLVALAEQYPDDVEISYQTAWVHDVMGLETEAVPYYQRALNKPGLAVDDRLGAFLGLGSTYRVLGRFDESVETFGRGLEEFPDDPALQTFLAMALYNRGQPGEAIQILLGVVATTSADQRVQTYRRTIEHYAGDLDAPAQTGAESYSAPGG